MNVRPPGDPDLPAGLAWIHVEISQPASTGGNHPDVTIELWKQGEGLVVFAWEAGLLIEEARAGPIESGYILRERDHLTRSQLLRMNVPRHHALSRALELLYRGMSFDVDRVAAIDGPDMWSDELEHIAREAEGPWRPGRVTSSVPPPTEFVTGWRWQEISHIDDETVMEFGIGIPTKLAGLDRREAFLRFSDDESEATLHVFWGTGRSSAELVVAPTPKQPVEPVAGLFAADGPGVIRSIGPGRSVALIAPEELLRRARLEVDVDRIGAAIPLWAVTVSSDRRFAR